MRILSVISLAMICCFNAMAQTPAATLPAPDATTQKIQYTEVVDVTGTAKADLYKRAKQLGILGANIKVDNPTEGIYSYKGQFQVKYHAPQPGLYHTGVVDYVVTVYCKDGKYKYVITDFVHSSTKGNGGKLEGALPECGKYVLSPSGWADIKKSVAEQSETLVRNLKLKMANPSGTGVPASGNDW